MTMRRPGDFIHVLGFLFLKCCAGAKPCYQELGCFPTDPPWFSALRPLPPPSTPEIIKTRMFLVTRKNLNNRHLIELHPTISIPRSGDYKWTRPHAFIVHGYVNNSTHPWVEKMKNAYLKKEDANMFLVDWGGASYNFNYFQAASDTRVVGAEMARFVAFLYKMHKVNPNQIHVIGHSLGAHVASYCGKKLKGNLGRITGLDPAQPCFEDCDPQVRIHKSDAYFVDILHTETMPFAFGGLGMSLPCGHVDIYANGGLFQPGCAPNPINIKLKFNTQQNYEESAESFGNFIGCSHLRALEYFIEALNSEDCIFWAKRATSMPLLRLAKGVVTQYLPIYTKIADCSIHECTALGLDTVNYPARGIFALKTNARHPFCQQNEETNTKMELARNIWKNQLLQASWILGQSQPAS